MRFELLGRRLQVRGPDGSGPHHITAPKVEHTLTALVVNAGHIVSVSQLIEEIWGLEPPRRATAAVHVYVSQLRKFLHGIAPDSKHVTTEQQGYVLSVASEATDLHDFRRLLARCRHLVRIGRYDEAVPLLHEVLQVSDRARRPVGEHGPIIGSVLRWLDDVRLECAEQVIDCKIALGRHREVVGYLPDLIREHPLYETFYRQLMLAYFHSDRRADALRVYHALHARMRAELGLDPCRAVQEVHAAILASDVPLGRLA